MRFPYRYGKFISAVFITAAYYAHYLVALTAARCRTWWRFVVFNAVWPGCFGVACPHLSSVISPVALAHRLQNPKACMSATCGSPAAFRAAAAADARASSKRRSCVIWVAASRRKKTASLGGSLLCGPGRSEGVDAVFTQGSLLGQHLHHFFWGARLWHLHGFLVCRLILDGGGKKSHGVFPLGRSARLPVCCVYLTSYVCLWLTSCVNLS